MRTNEVKNIHDGIASDICKNRDYSVLKFIEEAVVGNKNWQGYEHSDGTKVFMAIDSGCNKEDTLIVKGDNFLLFSQLSIQNNGVLKLQDGNLSKRGFNDEVRLRMPKDEFSATNMKETLKNNDMKDIAAVIDKYVPETYADMLKIKDDYKKTVTHQKKEKTQQNMENRISRTWYRS